jgi:sec-independent protein translocase protein TatA
MLVPLLAGDQVLIIAVIIIALIFGAGKIPELAKALGRAQGEFEKGKVESQMEVERLKSSASPSSSPPSDDHSKLVRAATDMGLPTDGLTDDQIRAEIRSSIA